MGTKSDDSARDAEKLERSGFARLGGGLAGSIAGIPFGIVASFFMPFRVLGGDCVGDEGWEALLCSVLGFFDWLVSLFACVGIATMVGGVIGWWLGKAAAAKDEEQRA